jgi:acid phosphatase (class A)
MPRFSRYFLLLLLLLLPQQGFAGESLYIAPERVNLSALLAPPPTIGSPQQQQEVKLLLKFQNERTPAQIAFARADMDRSVFRFQDVLGADFTAEKLPVLTAFFLRVRHNTDQILDPAKRYWNRPRPYVSDLALHPCVDKPDNASYPSGHSTFGTVTSILLANMVPEKQKQLYERAELYRLNREIGGAHYPSDVLAGHISGTVIAAFYLQDPAFQADFANAKAELRGVLGLPAR